MDNKDHSCCNEKFKTTIGGQALIEGNMMRGPEKDAIVIRGKEGLTLEVNPRKVRKPGSFAAWPFVRGAVNFFDSQVVGVKALMRSADLAPEEYAQRTVPAVLLDASLYGEITQEGKEAIIASVNYALKNPNTNPPQTARQPATLEPIN